MTVLLPDLSTCTASMGPRLRPGQFGPACGEPTTTRIEFGCVHEHVKSMEACQRHADLLSSTGILACGDCWEAGHDCPIIGRVASGANTGGTP